MSVAHAVVLVGARRVAPATAAPAAPAHTSRCRFPDFERMAVAPVALSVGCDQPRSHLPKAERQGGGEVMLLVRVLLQIEETRVLNLSRDLEGARATRWKAHLRMGRYRDVTGMHTRCRRLV